MSYFTCSLSCIWYLFCHRLHHICHSCTSHWVWPEPPDTALSGISLGYCCYCVVWDNFNGLNNAQIDLILHSSLDWCHCNKTVHRKRMESALNNQGRKTIWMERTPSQGHSHLHLRGESAVGVVASRFALVASLVIERSINGANSTSRSPKSARLKCPINTPFLASHWVPIALCSSWYES